jgi:hypothetical protein
MTTLQADKKIATTERAIEKAERRGQCTAQLYRNLEAYQHVRKHSGEVEWALKLIK